MTSSRVVVYVLLAAALFAQCGYRQVWARLVGGLDPGERAMAARRPRRHWPRRAAGSARHRCER